MRKLSFLILGLILNIIINNHAFNYNKNQKGTHMKEILKIENLKKYYGNEKNLTKAVNGLNMTEEEGEIVAIMGSSGSGKTTLLNCISTIDTITSGHIYIDGEDITEIDEDKLSDFRRDKLGFIFQDFNLLDILTIEENIALACVINGKNQDIDEKVYDISKKLGIENILKKFPYLIDYKNIILKNKIKIEVKDTQKIVYTDEKWLKFIIKQILQNSLKYLNKEDKEIEIKTKEEPHSITLIIKDNGVGIHDYDLPKIYNYGFTGSDRKKTHSTGIGLYLAKKLSEKLNLNLKTTSEYNKYTQTEITIPKESTYIIKEGDPC